MKEYFDKNRATVIFAFVIVMFGLCAFIYHERQKTHLEGSYTGTVTMLIFSGKDQINFSKNNTFTEGAPNAKKSDLNKGTYKIEGDKLHLTFTKSKAKATAKLAKDHNSFVIKKVTGALGSVDGTKFTKNSN